MRSWQRNLSLYLAALVIGLVVAWPTFFYPPGSDQASFLYVARIWNEGGLPYRDAFDIKPPAIFLQYRVADFLFPGTLYSYRFLEWFLMGLAIFPFLDLCRNSRGAFSCYALFLIVYFIGNDYWNLSQPDIMVGLIALQMMATLRNASVSRRRQTRFLFLAGLAFGLVLIYKQNNAILGILFLWPLIAERNRKRLVKNIAGAASGVALLPLLLAAYFFIRGGLAAFLDGTFFFPLSYARVGLVPGLGLDFYTNSIIELAPLLLISCAGVVGLLFKRGSHGAKILLSGLVCLFAAIAIQRKFFLYHWQPLYPIFAFLIVSGISRCVRMVNGSRAGSRLASQLVLGIAFGGLVTSCVLLATRVQHAGRSTMGSSNHYTGAIRNIVKWRADLDDYNYLETFIGPQHSAAADARLGHFVQTHASETKTLQLMDFRPAVYLYANRRCPHRYFFATVIGMLSGHAQVREIEAFRTETYETNRPDAMLFAEGGLFESAAVSEIHPGNNGYDRIAAIEITEQPQIADTNRSYALFISGKVTGQNRINFLQSRWIALIGSGDDRPPHGAL